MTLANHKEHRHSPITKDTDNPVNQSKLEVIPRSCRKAQENACERVTNGFGFTRGLSALIAFLCTYHRFILAFFMLKSLIGFFSLNKAFIIIITSDWMKKWRDFLCQSCGVEKAKPITFRQSSKNRSNLTTNPCDPRRFIQN